jgi:hypothetical protein
MNDNEIIKALECCICDECEDCPCDEEPACIENLHQEAIDLINRQKAEIERLNSPYEMQVEASKKLENSIKAEAVKEFAERLKENAVFGTSPILRIPYYHISVDGIDNLVKEMVGEG